MTSSEARMRLRNSWGPETVFRCCRYWKTHGYERMGRCGICRDQPSPVVGMTWDDVDAEVRGG